MSAAVADDGSEMIRGILRVAVLSPDTTIGMLQRVIGCGQELGIFVNNGSIASKAGANGAATSANDVSSLTMEVLRAPIGDVVGAPELRGDETIDFVLGRPDLRTGPANGVAGE